MVCVCVCVCVCVGLKRRRKGGVEFTVRKKRDRSMTIVKAKSAHGRAHPCTQVFFPIPHLERHVGREREGGGGVREKVDVSTTKISRGSRSRSLLHSPVPSANSLAPF